MRGGRGYAVLDPLSTFGPVLDRRGPVENFCCLCCKCSRKNGIYWALALILIEAIWHITVTILSPSWAWSHDSDSIIGLYQTVWRCVMIVLCLNTLKALLCGRAGPNGEPKGAKELRVFLRALVMLFWLQLLAIAFSAVTRGSYTPAACERFEILFEYTVEDPKSSSSGGSASDASWSQQQEYERAMEQARRYGMDARRCELLSDLIDYAWGLVTVIFIWLVVRVVHSHVAALGGATWSSTTSDAQRRQRAAEAMSEMTEEGVAGGVEESGASPAPGASPPVIVQGRPVACASERV